ncbi:MAG: GNAT family N-acetyltransferase [Pseudomonadales bacterium]
MIKVAEQRFSREWATLRNQLWPETLLMHLEVIDRFFNLTYPHIHIAFLALRATEVVGFLEVSLRSYAEGTETSPVPYVEGWYVADSARGQGHGRALMERAAQWALMSGYSVLASDAELANAQGIGAHQALGFIEVARHISMLKSL